MVSHLQISFVAFGKLWESLGIFRDAFTTPSGIYRRVVMYVCQNTLDIIYFYFYYTNNLVKIMLF
jgi:cellulose synthase/poly-beta-1,6-N-acetylglucosamine synthase-like glycosyltransferase